MTTNEKCPFTHIAGDGTSNRDWWPNVLRLDLLHQAVVRIVSRPEKTGTCAFR